jgi:hypothetical protein
VDADERREQEEDKALQKRERSPAENLSANNAAGEIGATRTDWRKPSRRSSMIEMVEKMAVKSMMRMSVPG